MEEGTRQEENSQSLTDNAPCPVHPNGINGGNAFRIPRTMSVVTEAIAGAVVEEEVATVARVNVIRTMNERDNNCRQNNSGDNYINLFLWGINPIRPEYI